MNIFQLYKKGRTECKNVMKKVRVNERESDKEGKRQERLLCKAGWPNPTDPVKTDIRRQGWKERYLETKMEGEGEGGRKRKGEEKE